jgi:hypothetical protein
MPALLGWDGIVFGDLGIEVQSGEWGTSRIESAGVVKLLMLDREAGKFPHMSDWRLILDRKGCQRVQVVQVVGQAAFGFWVG